MPSGTTAIACGRRRRVSVYVDRARRTRARGRRDRRRRSPDSSPARCPAFDDACAARRVPGARRRRSPTCGPPRTRIYGRFGYGLASYSGWRSILRASDRPTTPRPSRLDRRDSSRSQQPSLSSRRCGNASQPSRRACSRGHPPGGRRAHWPIPTGDDAAAATCSAPSSRPAASRRRTRSIVSARRTTAACDRVARRRRGDGRLARSDARDLALPARRRLGRARKGDDLADRSSASSAGGRAASAPREHARRTLGSARGRRCRAGGAFVRGGGLHRRRGGR